MATPSERSAVGPVHPSVPPSRMFRAGFEKSNPASQHLSRVITHAGTVTSPLLRWTSCGALVGAVLGPARQSYPPFAIFDVAARRSTASPTSKSLAGENAPKPGSQPGGTHE